MLIGYARISKAAGSQSLDLQRVLSTLKTIELQRLQSFDGVYIMGSPDGEDHYPVFEIPVAR